MNILSSHFFASAFQTRLMVRNKNLHAQIVPPSPMQENIRFEIDKIREDLGDTDLVVTLSDEAKEFMQSSTAQIKMEQDLYVGGTADMEDPFSARPRDQWAVFSEYLYDNGYYDNMSDQALQNMESMLMHITDGLDSLTMAGPDWYSGVEEPLDSGEAALELASSTAALSYFRDHYVPDDLKEGFNALIDDYYVHNKEVVSGYKSLNERFNEAVAKLSDDTWDLIENRQGYSKRSAKNERSLALRKYMGSISHSEEETLLQSALYTRIFSGIADSAGLERALLQAKTAIIDYACGGSTDHSVTNYLNQRSDDTFDRIDSYWSALLAA